MTFSSPPGEGLGALKSTSWKNILKTRCWSTDVTDGKPLVTVLRTIALRELLRKVVTSWRAKHNHEWPEGLPLRTVHCISLSLIWDCKKQVSLECKEVDVNNKWHARIRIWAFACKWVLFFLILLWHLSLRLVLCWAGPDTEDLSNWIKWF